MEKNELRIRERIVELQTHPGTQSLINRSITKMKTNVITPKIRTSMTCPECLHPSMPDPIKCLGNNFKFSRLTHYKCAILKAGRYEKTYCMSINCYPCPTCGPDNHGYIDIKVPNAALPDQNAYVRLMTHLDECINCRQWVFKQDMDKHFSLNCADIYANTDPKYVEEEHSFDPPKSEEELSETEEEPNILLNPISEEFDNINTDSTLIQLTTRESNSITNIISDDSSPLIPDPNSKTLTVNDVYSDDSDDNDINNIQNNITDAINNTNTDIIRSNTQSPIIDDNRKSSPISLINDLNTISFKDYDDLTDILEERGYALFPDKVALDFIKQAKEKMEWEDKTSKANKVISTKELTIASLKSDNILLKKRNQNERQLNIGITN